MLRKIKNFLLSICKKKLLLGVSFFILLGALIPRISHAGIAARIGVALVVSTLYLGSTIVLFMLKITEAILAWVMSPNFMGALGYTNPATNPVIQTGLNVTQGFVNMILVLILVFLAIATILRITGYETKKLLVTFIVVALLVNFSPVITGLVVDSSNIIMTFFLGRISEGGFGDEMKTQVDNLSGDLLDEDELAKVGQMAGQTMFLLILIGMLSLILLMFSAVFMFRYLAIWMLVILSPLAFAAYILPKTRKYFEAWWKQLLNWSFVGVTCGFFLYLSILLIRNIGAIPTPDAGETDAFNRALPYLVSSAFLAMGLLVGLKTSAMGASTIINATKRRAIGATKKTAGWTAKKTWQGMNLADRKIVPKVFSKDEEGKRRFLQLTTARHAAEGITTNWDRIPVAKWFRPEPLKKFSEFRGALLEEEKHITGDSQLEMDKVIHKKYTGKRAAATVYSLIKTRGDSQDVIKAFAKKYGYYNKKTGKVDDEGLLKDKGFLHDKTLIGILDFIKKTGNRGKMFRMDSRLAKVGKSEEAGQVAMVKAIKDAKPADIAGQEREVIDNLEVMEASMAVRGEDYFRSVGRLKGGVLARRHTMKKVYSSWVDTEVKEGKRKVGDENNNKDFYKYLSKKYHVDTPGIESAQSNIRFTSLGYDESFKYMTPAERKIEPGTISTGKSMGIGEDEGRDEPEPPPKSKPGRRPGGTKGGKQGPGGSRQKPKGRSV